MKQLYAPWRSDYTLGISDKKNGKACPFCVQGANSDQDKKNFIIKRYKHCFVMLNLYPYNAGHVMVIPFEHKADLSLLSQEARYEIIEVVSHTISILQTTIRAEGLNVGFNLGGKAAGGSIPEHLHLHVVPRWLGDTNFLVALTDTKPISVNLVEIYEKLKKAFESAPQEELLN